MSNYGFVLIDIARQRYRSRYDGQTYTRREIEEMDRDTFARHCGGPFAVAPRKTLR